MARKISPHCGGWIAGLAALLLLAGCPTPPRGPLSPPHPGIAPAPAHGGHAYEIVAGDSLLTVLVYRGGALALAGHNHIVASHELSGTLYVTDDLVATGFELHVPLDSLSVDEPQLRAREGVDFPPDVPDSAREGTRHNMLGPALLDAEHYPQIVLSADRLASVEADRASAHMRVDIRGQQHFLDVPTRFQRDATQVVVEGELALKQTDLGLTPFSALLGALQVLDEMRVRFRLVARARLAGEAPRRREEISEGVTVFQPDAEVPSERLADAGAAEKCALFTRQPKNFHLPCVELAQ
jgi:polyisoprenoid-binding protein YceI